MSKVKMVKENSKNLKNSCKLEEHPDIHKQNMQNSNCFKTNFIVNAGKKRWKDYICLSKDILSFQCF